MKLDRRTNWTLATVAATLALGALVLRAFGALDFIEPYLIVSAFAIAIFAIIVNLSFAVDNFLSKLLSKLDGRPRD